MLSPTAKRFIGVCSICGCGFILALVALINRPSLASSPELAITSSLSILLALVLGLVGLWLWRQSISPQNVLRIAGWMVIGMASLGTLFLWTLTHQLAHGETMAQAHFVLANTLVAGGVLGIAIGLYDVRGKRYQRELEQERAKLADERAKLAFLNRMLRHYVLNGVNIITGHLTLLTGSVGPAGREHVDVIRDQSEDVADIVRKFRYLTQALLDETELQPRDLSADLSRRVTITAQSYEHAQIQADIPDGVTVLADELLDQVFENLLTNAIVHNDRDQPQVEVSVTDNTTDDTDDEFVLVEIADNGPGIPAEQYDSLLEWESKREEDESAGIGLAIVDTVVERYNGTVTFAENEPRGTLVSLELPGTAEAVVTTDTADPAAHTLETDVSQPTSETTTPGTASPTSESNTAEVSD